MTNGTRNTLRNAAWVPVQRSAQLVVGVCFALVIPRLMGPEHYGRYALATSVAAWLALLSGLGLVNATTRYLPQLLARHETAVLQRLIGNLFTLRVISGLLAALLYLTVGRWWWPDPAPAIALVMAVTVLARGLSCYLFSIVLALIQAGHCAFGDTPSRSPRVGLALS